MVRPFSFFVQLRPGLLQDVTNFLKVLRHSVVNYAPKLRFAVVMGNEEACVGQTGVIVALAVVIGLDGGIVRFTLNDDERIQELGLSLAVRQMTKSARAWPDPRPVTSRSSSIWSKLNPYSLIRTQRYSCRTVSSGVSSSHFLRMWLQIFPFHEGQSVVGLASRRYSILDFLPRRSAWTYFKRAA